MSGYVRIHRTLVGHPAFRNDAEAMAFAWMVVRAAWKPCRVRYKERAINLGRGQLSISQRDMARALDRDKAWIERLWKRLKDEAMIHVASEAGVAVITICNYGQYQDSSAAREAVDEAPREVGARQAQGTEQVREEVKKEEKDANASYARTANPFSVVPPGVRKDHWRDFCANRKTRRLTNSETAYAGQMKALDDLSDDEWPPGRLVEYAACKGWGSINDPRDSFNGQSRQSHSQQRMAGHRPHAGLALIASADEDERAEGFSGNQADHRGAFPEIPRIGHG